MFWQGRRRSSKACAIFRSAGLATAGCRRVHTLMEEQKYRRFRERCFACILIQPESYLSGGGSRPIRIKTVFRSVTRKDSRGRYGRNHRRILRPSDRWREDEIL